MMYRHALVPLLICALSLACGDDGPAPMREGGSPMACPDPELVCSYESTHGTSIGDTLPPFNLSRCNETCSAYPHSGLCDPTDAVGTDTVRYTVVTIAAGWCVPCRNESAILSEQITDAYREHGVEVIQILTQKDDYTPADSTFCEGWSDAYDLTRPNFTQLMDTNGDVGGLWPGGTLPVTYILSATGEILYKVTGANDELADLKTQLDAALCRDFLVRCG